MRHRRTLLALAGLALGLLTMTHPTHAAATDTFLTDLAQTQDFTAGSPRQATPIPDGSAVLFLRSGPRDRVLNLYEFTVATRQTREILTPQNVLKGAAEHLSIAEKARRERMRVTARGFTSFQLSHDGSLILVPLSGKIYVVRRADRHVTELPGDGWIDSRFSPDSKFVAGVHDNELYVVTLATGAAKQLTRGATETLTHGVSEFVAQEEMSRFTGFWWSPDSKMLAYQETDLSPVEQLYIPDPGNPDQAPIGFRYPRAGTPNARVRVGLIARTGSKTVWPQWDRENYPYLCRVIWDEKNAPLTLLVMNRHQREEKLLAVDAASGAVHELWTETDAAWLNLPDDSRFPRWLPSGKEFLWMTERNGDWQIEMHDRDGKLIHALTPVGFHPGILCDVDEAAKNLIVTGGPDSREIQLYSVSFDGGEPTPITTAPGDHDAVFSKNHAIFVHGFSLLDGTSGQQICDKSYREIAELPSVAERPPFLPKIELTRVGDGTRAFDAVVIRPRNFEAGKKYPVLLSVYAGPTVKVVSATARGYFQEQWIADHGYIVVSLDGRGTPGHGRAWERAVQGNLIDIALDDQVTGLQLLGAKYPEMDMSRVGVNGWSFGGYFTAMATIRRPDIFACGIAGAPVTDWKNYDTFYTERYLQLPQDNPGGYHKSSVLTYASQLERPLLIVHGVTDDNVYFVNSLQLCEALFEAGKPYEFLPMTGTHLAGAEDPTQNIRLWERIMGFLNAHLTSQE